MTAILTCVVVVILGFGCKSAARSQPTSGLESVGQLTCKNLPNDDYKSMMMYLNKVAVDANHNSVRKHWVDLNTGKTSYQALDDALTLVFKYTDHAERKALAKEAVGPGNFGNLDWNDDDEPKQRSFVVIEEAGKQGTLKSLRDALVHILSEHNTNKY